MIASTRLPVRTAEKGHTIWQNVSEDDFRRHLVALEECTNAVPIASQTFALQNTAFNQNYPTSRLPLEVEQHVADDFAFLAAVQEGAQSVAAVCLEQHLKPRAFLGLRIAAADAVSDIVRSTLSEICGILMYIARTPLHDSASEQIFSRILDLHRPKILGRLRSRLWVKPAHLTESHKKALWQDFANVVHRVQFVYPAKRDRHRRKAVEDQIIILAGLYESLEKVGENDLVEQLNLLVRSTYDFCKDDDIRQFAAALETLRPTAQIAAALKCLHQLEKVGAYWRIAINLVEAAERHPLVFHEITTDYLTPYAPEPTCITYESWARTCHVHAEVQLVVFYDTRWQDTRGLESEIVWPSIIGTSKYLCYLCFLFIKCHARFFAANTHGKLYDQWTVPDLLDYNEATRQSYAGVISEMDRTVCEQLSQKLTWRVEPMTSRQNLLIDGITGE